MALRLAPPSATAPPESDLHGLDPCTSLGLRVRPQATTNIARPRPRRLHTAMKRLPDKPSAPAHPPPHPANRPCAAARMRPPSVRAPASAAGVAPIPRPPRVHTPNEPTQPRPLRGSLAAL
ncbi:hypothetical protein VTO73DRAFT_6312 [Trametes versicolor]